MQKKLTHTSNASVNIRTDIICHLRFPAKNPDAEVYSGTADVTNH